MYQQIKKLADEAIALQNKDRMDAVLREISGICSKESATAYMAETALYEKFGRLHDYTGEGVTYQSSNPPITVSDLNEATLTAVVAEIAASGIDISDAAYEAAGAKKIAGLKAAEAKAKKGGKK